MTARIIVIIIVIIVTSFPRMTRTIELLMSYERAQIIETDVA